MAKVKEVCVICDGEVITVAYDESKTRVDVCQKCGNATNERKIKPRKVDGTKRATYIEWCDEKGIHCFFTKTKGDAERVMKELTKLQKSFTVTFPRYNEIPEFVQNPDAMRGADCSESYFWKEH